MSHNNIDKQIEVDGIKNVKNLRFRLALMVAIVWSSYTLAYLYRVDYHLDVVIYSITHRAISAGLISILVFLLYTPKKGMTKDRLHYYDIIPILFTIAGCAFIAIKSENLFVMGRVVASPVEMILGGALFLCFLEATRRTLGLPISILILLFFFYGVYSNHFPGFLYGRAHSYKALLGWIFLGRDGLWGMILGIVSTTVAGFILFGGFLRATGASPFFTDLAFATVGFMRGGVAKAAIIASTLFGTISGSISANVATTGQITIPAMKKTGFSPDYAGAVESVASTGGMFTPPVMGATAFLMAEFLETSYWAICVASFLPALIYYSVLYVQVHLEAVRLGMEGIPRDKTPSLSKILMEGWQYILPFVLLIFLLAVLRYSAETSIMYTIAGFILVSFLRKNSRLTPKKLADALVDSAKGMMPIIPAGAAIGVLIGTLNMTGAATNLASDLIDISGGSMFLLLFMAAGASFILGMGMTTVSVYLLTVVLLAPALIKSGVHPIAAHMFLFYFGCISFITPPVCMACFVAASISGGNVMKTGWCAMRLGIIAFVIPWSFVYNPGILFIGSARDILMAFIFTIIAGLCIACAIAGLLIKKLKSWERVLFAVTGLCLLMPDMKIRWIALLIAVILLITQFLERRRDRFINV